MRNFFAGFSKFVGSLKAATHLLQVVAIIWKISLLGKTALSHSSAPSKVGQTLHQGEGTSGEQVTFLQLTGKTRV